MSSLQRIMILEGRQVIGFYILAKESPKPELPALLETDNMTTTTNLKI